MHLPRTDAHTHTNTNVAHWVRWTQSPWIWPSPVCLKRNSGRFPGTLWGSHCWGSQKSQNSPLSSAEDLDKGQNLPHFFPTGICIKEAWKCQSPNKEPWNTRRWWWAAVWNVMVCSSLLLCEKHWKSRLLTLVRDSLWPRTSWGSSRRKERRWGSWEPDLWWWAAAQLGNEQ